MQIKFLPAPVKGINPPRKRRSPIIPSGIPIKGIQIRNRPMEKDIKPMISAAFR